MTNPSDIQEAFRNITQWKRGGQRAPHKPLLVLYALDRCQRSESRHVSYAEVDKVLKRLLVEFGPSRKQIHPELPFWRLQNDGLWELQNAEQIVIPRKNANVKRRELLEFDVQGGFPKETYAKLSRDPELVAKIAKGLLDENFPQTVHEDILQAVGLDIETGKAVLPKRDPEFREKVLRAYEYSCAVCGFNIRVGDSLVALEAAHIRWHQSGGPSTEVNGLALCSMHHKLFDRGAFSINPSLKIQVSERAHGTGFNEWLKTFHGKSIRHPQSPDYNPKEQFIYWHIHEVFQAPARYSPE